MSKDPVSKTKDVRAAVDAELGFDPLVDSARITVRNIAGDVTLTGTVPSYPQYLEAVAAAPAAPGGLRAVRHVWVIELENQGYAGPPAVIPPPGSSTTPRKPQRAISTPPATTGSRSSARSPAARPTATRTSCRSGRCRAT
jgi:BON domain